MLVLAGGEGRRGIGVPLGGAAIVDLVRAERPIEAVRKPLVDLIVERGQLCRTSLWPPTIAAAPGEPPLLPG